MFIAVLMLYKGTDMRTPMFEFLTLKASRTVAFISQVGNLY